jgi:hypothetical protein
VKSVTGTSSEVPLLSTFVTVCSITPLKGFERTFDRFRCRMDVPLPSVAAVSSGFHNRKGVQSRFSESRKHCMSKRVQNVNWIPTLRFCVRFDRRRPISRNKRQSATAPYNFDFRAQSDRSMVVLMSAGIGSARTTQRRFPSGEIPNPDISTCGRFPSVAESRQRSDGRAGQRVW